MLLTGKHVDIHDPVFCQQTMCMKFCCSALHSLPHCPQAISLSHLTASTVSAPLFESYILTSRFGLYNAVIKNHQRKKLNLWEISWFVQNTQYCLYNTGNKVWTRLCVCVHAFIIYVIHITDLFCRTVVVVHHTTIFLYLCITWLPNLYCVGKSRFKILLQNTLFTGSCHLAIDVILPPDS